MNKKIYIAGKYDDVNVVNVLNNIREGIVLAIKVLKNGDIPFCPFLDFMFVLLNPDNDLKQEDFKKYSLEWLYVCDEIWLLPSWMYSGGCKVEIEEAEKRGIIIVEKQEWERQLNTKS